MRGIEDFKGYQTRTVYDKQSRSFRTVTLSPMFPALKTKRVMSSKANRPAITRDQDHSAIDEQDQKIAVLHPADDLRRLNV